VRESGVRGRVWYIQVVFQVVVGESEIHHVYKPGNTSSKSAFVCMRVWVRVISCFVSLCKTYSSARLLSSAKRLCDVYIAVRLRKLLAISAWP